MKEWLKGVGKAVVDAGKAKLDDTMERRKEAELSDVERLAWAKFKALTPAELAGTNARALPPCPSSESMFTRREIRALLHHPEFFPVLRAGEAARHAALAAAEAERLRAEERDAADKAARLARVTAFYDNELNPIELPLRPVREALKSMEYQQLRDGYLEKVEGRKVEPNVLNTTGLGVLSNVLDLGTIKIVGERFGRGLEQFVIRRTLRDFPEGERAVLRLAAVLGELGLMTREEVYAAQLPLVWNDGKSLVLDTNVLAKAKEQVVFREVANDTIAGRYGTRETAAEIVQARCRQALDANSGVAGALKAVLMQHLYQGTRWLTGERAVALAPKGLTKTALRLGAFPNGAGELVYDLNESLITIAPPGAGKSQAHVLRNLLYLDAPAIVLDVKGEMFAGSAAWRQANVGPVYRFAPADPANSLRFNPLDFIGTDPDEAFEQAEQLAELLTVPAGKGEYFDDRAIQVIQAVVLFVALEKSGRERSMETVLDLLSGGYGDDQRPADDKEWDGQNAFLADLALHEAPSLRRMGRALSKMPPKQLEGVFDTARNKLKVWEAPSIARLTADTTFTPAQLRGERATLYICVSLADISRFASVIRVLLGMCMNHLTRAEAEAGAETVTCFLDELPQLNRMDVVERALNTARGYGVRVWMFAQNFGQLETAYPNAKAMLGACKARSYMNPDDDTAKWLSGHLGEQRGLLDGAQKPLVQSYELTGEGFRDSVVVMLSGFDNARVAKVPAYQDPVCQARMKLPAPASQAA